MDTINVQGYTFMVEIIPDQDMGAPWEEHDGHGIVSEWVRRDKKPGERILHEDRGARRYYDVQETLKKARKEGWGLGPAAMQALAECLKRTPTKGEIAAQAVENDYGLLRAWCANEWCWVGVKVTLLAAPIPVEVHADTYTQALWGIESDADADHAEVAAELAAECIEQFQEYAAGVLA